MTDHSVMARVDAQGEADRSWRFTKTRMCKFELLGVCAKGDQCPFAHRHEEMKPVPDLTCTKLCRSLIQTGSCGDTNCKYAHRKEELRSTSAYHKTKMCKFSQTGTCALGWKCNFAHSELEMRPLEPGQVPHEPNACAQPQGFASGGPLAAMTSASGFCGPFANFADMHPGLSGLAGMPPSQYLDSLLDLAGAGAVARATAAALMPAAPRSSGRRALGGHKPQPADARAEATSRNQPRGGLGGGRRGPSRFAPHAVAVEVAEGDAYRESPAYITGVSAGFSSRTPYLDATTTPAWHAAGRHLASGNEVKNTFLTFSPDAPPMRSVRTADGALCSLAESEDSSS